VQILLFPIDARPRVRAVIDATSAAARNPPAMGKGVAKRFDFHQVLSIYPASA
jgi:hypothetical protein